MSKKKGQHPEKWQQQLKNLDQAKNDYFNQEVDEIIQQTYEENEAYHRLVTYNQAKKMQWWHYLISFGVAFFFTGLSFLIGYLTKNSNKAPDYQAAGWASLGFVFLLILLFMVINYNKNRNAEKYFHDKRRRYQRTFSFVEAKQLLVLKIIFLAIVLLSITVIVTNVVFQP